MNNETKRDYPFPNTSSTPLTPVTDDYPFHNASSTPLTPVTDDYPFHDGNVDWHKLIKTDDNPPPLFEERSELYPGNLLKRIEALEKENEDLKIVIALIFAIASKYSDKLAEPDAWAIVKNFVHDKGIPNMAFDLNKGKTKYRYLDDK